jgi:hypothetical protein
MGVEQTQRQRKKHKAEFVTGAEFGVACAYASVHAHRHRHCGECVSENVSGSSMGDMEER